MTQHMPRDVTDLVETRSVASPVPVSPVSARASFIEIDVIAHRSARGAVPATTVPGRP